MKSIYFIVTVTMASLFVSGCGEDRSHGTNLSEFGEKTSWIYNSDQGKIMVENNFVYIPGGFDVDGDGVEEGGFWLAKYEAKDDNTSDEVIDVSGITNVENFIAKNFQVFDPTSQYKKFDKTVSQDSGYTMNSASEIVGLSTSKVIFNESGESVKNVSPLEAVISLQNSQINNGYEILLPSEKQWMHLVKLITNNPENWTGKEVGKGKLFQGNKYGIDDRNTFVIENSILGEDSYVPKDYQVNVSDLSGGVAEWTSGMVAIEDRFLTGDSGKQEYNDINSIPVWWKPILKDQTISLGSIEGAGQYHDGSAIAGTNDSLVINADGTKGDVDNYAVVARGGSNSIDDNTLVGIGAAKLNYGIGYQGPTVGFRAASDYLY